MEEWFKQSFGSDYLIVYKHRDMQGAYDEVKRMVSWLNLPQKANILDLCCGMGRHALALTEFGYQVTGVDLSQILLQEARKLDPKRQVNWIHGDMRNIPIDTTFDAVVNLFTSFGYFDSDEENARVLCEIDRLLKPGGKFIIDFLNASYVQANLVPYSQRTQDGIVIEERRSIHHKTVVKQITIEQESSPQRHYTERVMLYGLPDFERMLAATDLHIDQVYGDYIQSHYDETQSPRLIIVGHKGGVTP